MADKTAPVSKDNATAGDTDSKMKAACESFESIFLHQLFKQMRATVPESGLLEGGMAKEIYTDMMDGEVSRKLAGEKGIGLARMLENQLRQMNLNSTAPTKK